MDEHARTLNLDTSTLTPAIRAIVSKHDASTFTPKMLFKELAESLRCPVETITDDPDVKARVKSIARELAATAEPVVIATPAPSSEAGSVAAAPSTAFETKLHHKPDAPDVKPRAAMEAAAASPEEEEEEEPSSPREKKKAAVMEPKARRRKERAEPMAKAPQKKRLRKAKEEGVKPSEHAPQQQLRKLVKDLGLGPSTFRGLPKESDAYTEELERRIIHKCHQLKIVHSSEDRLPTPQEVTTYARRRKRERELEGLEMSNILETTGERPRRAARAATPRVAPPPVEEESEEEEEKPIEQEAENEASHESDEDEHSNEEEEEENKSSETV